MAVKMLHKSTSPLINVSLYRAATTGDVNLLMQALEDESLVENLPHMETPQHNSILHLAASFGHARVVQLILKKCSSIVNKKSSKGCTALHNAARHGHLTLTRLLIDHANAPIDIEAGGALLRIANLDGNTALHEALKYGHSKVAFELIKEDLGLLSMINNKGESPFYLAAEAGLHELVAELIKLPIDHLLREEQEGKTALHAAIKGKHKGIVDLLVKEIPDLVRVRDAHGRSTLHYAIASGSLPAVRCMLQNDNSVAHYRDYDGVFPIHIAASKGCIGLIQEILHHSPESVELLDRRGRNALHIAIENRQENTVKYIMRTPELEKLINEGDAEGNTPLHVATIEARVIIVSILVQDKRVHINAVNSEGLTPYETADIYAAAKSSFQKIVIMMALKSAHSPPHRGRLFTGVNKDDDIDQEKNTTRKSFKDRTNTLILVATLISTVTFAAGFTMPGGFRNNEPKEGIATMLGNSTFHVFVISNTIAMYSSILAAITLMWAQIGDITLLTHASKMSMSLLAIALIMMAMAFGAGVYLVVNTLKWLATLVVIMSFIFIVGILVLFVPLQLQLAYYEYRWMRFICIADLLLLFARKIWV